MFEQFNRKKTVKAGFATDENQIVEWLPIRDLIENSRDVICVGYIRGKNNNGEFMALIGDDNNAYYLPSWYLKHADAYTEEETDYLMNAGAIIGVEKISISNRANSFTYVISLTKDGETVNI